MASIDRLKKNIINQINASSDEDLLTWLNQLLEKSNSTPHQFNDFELAILRMSQEDVKEGRLSSHFEVMKRAKEWLENQI